MQLLALNIETGRLSLVKQKHLVNDTALAMSTLFEPKILEKFNREIDSALAKTDVLAESKIENHAAKSQQAQQVVSELNKLSGLFGQARMR